MSVYLIVQLRVHDAAEFDRYKAAVVPLLKRHGASVIARSPETEVLEGDWALPRTVIIRFPTADDVRRWHADPDYQAIAVHRLRAAETNMVMVEGAD